MLRLWAALVVEKGPYVITTQVTQWPDVMYCAYAAICSQCYVYTNRSHPILGLFTSLPAISPSSLAAPASTASSRCRASLSALVSTTFRFPLFAPSPSMLSCGAGELAGDAIPRLLIPALRLGCCCCCLCPGPVTARLVIGLAGDTPTPVPTPTPVGVEALE